MNAYGLEAPLISLTISNFIGGSESVNIWGVQSILVMWQLVFASCHLLKSNKKSKKKVPEGHGRSFRSWPWQKYNYCLHSHFSQTMSLFKTLQATELYQFFLFFRNEGIFTWIHGQKHNPVFPPVEPVPIIFHHWLSLGISRLRYWQPHTVLPTAINQQEIHSKSGMRPVLINGHPSDRPP